MQNYKMSQGQMKEFRQLSLFTFLSLIAIISCNSDMQPTTLIQTSQTHIIPNGSYFQYTFTSMKLEQAQYNATISSYVIKYSLDFQPKSTNTSIMYNLLVFPQNNPDSQFLYQSYVRAVVQALPGLMAPFQNSYTDPTGSCQQCYQNAIESNKPMACLGCNASSLCIITNSQNWISPYRPWNSTIMTVIDNSLVIGLTGDLVTVNLGYEIDILYQEEYEALFILFLSVICALIIILSVLAVFITLRIKRVEKEISECKSKIKTD